MDILLAYLNSFGIAALIAIAFGVSLRATTHLMVARIFVGLLFGVAAVLAMNNPIHIAEGVFVDPRSLFIGLSAAFLGPAGALVTLSIAIVGRVSLGGVGVSAGLLSMCIAASSGLAWAYLMKSKACTRVQCLILLGAMISLALFGTLLLPRDAMITLLVTAGPYMVGFNLVGAVLFGSLMERERIAAHRFGQLQALATTDPLTGLLNRRGFDTIIPTLADEQKSDTAVLIVDLDHFKGVNDTLGHDVGDKVLTQVADVLRHSVRKGDIISRFGGEEFVVMLTNTDAAEARRIGERVRIAIGEVSLSSRGQNQRISASVGGFWAHANFDQVEALRKADRALYRAKEMGRNRTEFYECERDTV